MRRPRTPSCTLDPELPRSAGSRVNRMEGTSVNGERPLRSMTSWAKSMAAEGQLAC